MSQPKGIALVTGGAQRIGKAICLSLADHGYTIALHYNHSRADAQRVRKQIREKGGCCEVFKSDFSNEKQAQALIPSVLKKFATLSLLINNASIFEKSGLKAEGTASLSRHLSINFKAPYLLTQQFAKKCRKGQIINILDTNIVKNKITHSAYFLSKKSLYELTKSAAVELAPHIRVNGIAPGLILPPAHEKNAYLNRLAKHVPLKKKGSVSHITQTIQFFLENNYLTGQVIFVDGGEHLT